MSSILFEVASLKAASEKARRHGRAAAGLRASAHEVSRSLKASTTRTLADIVESDAAEGAAAAGVALDQAAKELSFASSMRACQVLREATASVAEEDHWAPSSDSISAW